MAFRGECVDPNLSPNTAEHATLICGANYHCEEVDENEHELRTQAELKTAAVAGSVLTLRYMTTGPRDRTNECSNMFACANDMKIRAIGKHITTFKHQ